VALGGGRHSVYGNSLQEIAHRGWSRYGRQQDKTQQQLIGRAWLGRSEPRLWISQRRKQWFPRWSKHPKRTGRSCRPAGPLLRTDMAKQGFFILLRWLIGFFRPLHQQGFSFLSIYKFPLYGVVCVGLDRICIRR